MNRKNFNLKENMDKLMKSDKKRLFENFISMGIIQVVTFILPLITLPYLSRVLGVENFGRVFFAVAFVQYFAILTDFGFDLSAVREVSINRENKEKLDEIFNSVICGKFILLVVCYVLMYLIVNFVPMLSENQLIYHFAFLMVVGNVFFPGWFFQGIEHMKYITALNVFSKIISVILIFTCIKEQSDFVYYPLLNSLGFILAAIFAFALIIKRFNVKIFVPSIKSIVEQYKKSLTFFLSRISASAFSNTNVFFLGFIVEPLSLGYYVSAEKIYNACDQINTPLNNALYPYMAKKQDKVFYKKLLLIASFITVVVALFIMMFAKDILSIFYGKEMIPAYSILMIFAVTLVIKIPATMFGYCGLAAFGYPKEANYSVVYSSIIHIVGLVFLYCTKLLSVYSIAIMLVISTVFMFLFRLYYLNKYKIFSKGEVNEL